MKLLVAFAVIGLVAGKSVDNIVNPLEGFDYHRDVGVPMAARIKAAEEAMDFDGVRIVGGSPAALGEYPFLGGLLITLLDGRTSVCGSSLLSSTRSVTAAHCWRTLLVWAREFTLVWGSTTLFTGGTRVTTRDVEIHSGFNLITPINDIAIIRHSEVTMTDFIQPIPIATGDNNFVGTIAWAAGYGHTSDGGVITTGQYQSHVSMEVVNNSVCLGVYGVLNVRASTLCTSTTGGRGTCRGDSGGPLVADGVLIGVTSYGHTDGCETNQPAGFTRVTSFADWIQERM